MLGPNDLDKLCHGRIVLAEVYDSAGNGPAGPHFGIILNSDEAISKFQSNPTYRVVCISHNETIDPEFIMDVPNWIGLEGKIVGSWVTPVAEAAIEKVGHKLHPVEMLAVHKLVGAADAARRRTTQ